MMTDVKSKREYLSNIASYLLELGVLTNKKIKKDDLSSVDRVAEIRAKVTRLEELPLEKFRISFAEKKYNRFGHYIQGLCESNNGEVYIWTSKTNVCGLYKVASIRDIDFSFPFEINDEGIVVFLSADLKDKLILDFSFDPAGNKIIDIEAQGENWSKIKY